MYAKQREQRPSRKQVQGQNKGQKEHGSFFLSACGRTDLSFLAKIDEVKIMKTKGSKILVVGGIQNVRRGLFEVERSRDFACVCDKKTRVSDEMKNLSPLC